ncbi:Lon-like ATP-dependent protease [Methanobrevibacter gottschalkii]|uniref:Archaeal Lon protease n=3 Tax=Methanobacteriaceae TaxID=2159 RepID=A0A3N5B3A6_9EURY|nr:ATP-dependent protease LonB [Methanobrevibacter sp. A27]RPF51777.1 Lon-like ATP-dependent protease [Methanobrevibacter gottschalkii DSM 11977]SEK97062.1 Lon-like ATP-dependent protease [Methanobrevibacter gottschalkii]
MKFEEVEITEDSPQELVAEPVVEKEDHGEETKPMLDYDNIKSSQDIEVPPLLIDQVIGHEDSIETIKKAAKQRRNVLLIGDPGVGKSMLAKGMAQILPHETLKDVLVYPNMEDNNHPLIRTVPAGEGKKIVKATKGSAKSHEEKKTIITMFAIGGILVIGFMYGRLLESIIAAALILLISIQIKPKNSNMSPKLLVNNQDSRFAPFMDATGSHAGALLGDVRHDPYQSGGLGTPAHERVEAGMIHKANRGVLYIDEIGTMSMKTQQELLSAMQEKQYAITGQSENSSGAMVRSQAVPCDFVLVASGNLQVLEGMHIAMRSRIRGYGYEVFMKDYMEDTTENREKLVQFVAQEVKNDGRIPHFATDALDEIIMEAKRRSGKQNALTLRLRDLGGLVRSAGDVAIEKGANLVTAEHVFEAKKYARTLEQQIADRSILQRKDYSMVSAQGGRVGLINGLAVIGDRSGIVSPIAAEAAPTQSKTGGKIIATGKLGEIANESVQNVSALIKKYTNKDISNYDIHVQFIQTYDGVEGDSASVSIATAVISAIEEIPIDQTVALTGSLNVRGDVMPIGGATAKIEAAAEAGMKKVLIPKSNLKDVMIEKKYEDMIEIIPTETLSDVLENILISGSSKDKLIAKMKNLSSKVADKVPQTGLNNPTIN